MNKIKSIQQLKLEKQRLKSREEELENDIKNNWKELRIALKPGNIVKDTLNEEIKTEMEENLNGGSVLKSTFNYGLSLLARKFTDKAGEKISGFFKKPGSN